MKATIRQLVALLVEYGQTHVAKVLAIESSMRKLQSENEQLFYDLSLGRRDRPATTSIE